MTTTPTTSGKRPAYFDAGIPEHLRKCAKYLRMSKDFKGDGLGIDRQGEITDQYLGYRQLTGQVVDTYEDTVSATSGERRREYERLVLDVESGRIDTIVCVDLDRLVRLNDELETLIKLGERLGHLYVLTGTGWMDLANEDDQLTARIRATIANHETRKKAVRQKRAVAQQLDMGKAPAKRSFGYQPGGTELDPVEAVAVEAAYKHILLGGSLAGIARAWNEVGLRSASYRKVQKQWRGETVRHVLMNPRNAAIRTYYGEEIGPGTWPAIVDEPTYRTVVALLNDPSRRMSGGDTRKKHLGGGLYRCAQCGGPMKSDWRTNPADRGGKRVRLYRCQEHHHITRAFADEIDFLVNETVKAYLARREFTKAVGIVVPELTELTAQRSKVTTAMKEVRDAFGDGDLTRAEMKEQLDRQAAKLADIARREELLMADVADNVILNDLLRSDDPVAYYEAADVIGKQAVIHLLFKVTLLPHRSGIKVFDPETVKIEPR